MRYKKESVKLYEKKLFDFILRLDDPWKIIALKHFFSEDEIVKLGKRLIIAEMIKEGKQNREIANKLDVGFDTITFVRRWLRGNPRGGRNPKRGYSRTRKQEKESRFTGNEFQNFLNRYPGKNALLKALFGK